MLLGGLAQGRRRPAHPVHIHSSQPGPSFCTFVGGDHRRAIGGLDCAGLLWRVCPRGGSGPLNLDHTSLRVQRAGSFRRAAKVSLPEITATLGTRMAALWADSRGLKEEIKALFLSSPPLPCPCWFPAPLGFCLMPANSTFRALSSLSRGPWGMGFARGRVRGPPSPPRGVVHTSDTLCQALAW